MKAKLIIILLIGMLIGTSLGGFLGQIYYLKKIYSRLDYIYYGISDINSDVDDIEDQVENIYYKQFCGNNTMLIGFQKTI